VASPYPTGTYTPKDTPSFPRRDNVTDLSRFYLDSSFRHEHAWDCAQVLAIQYIGRFCFTRTNKRYRQLLRSVTNKYRIAATRIFSTLFFVTLIATVANASPGSAKNTLQLYFTKDLARDGSPASNKKRSFDCSDKIYAVITTQNIEPGSRKIEVVWYNPRGRRQERTTFSAFFTGHHDRAWAWLSLHRPDDAIIDRVLLQNRAAGMEDFVGTWTAKVYLNGVFEIKRSFDVYC